MYTKKLVGKKCFISPMCSQDAAIYTQWLNDLEVTQNLVLSASCVTEDDERNVIEEISKNHDYSIIDLESEKLIGSIGLDRFDSINNTAELGIFIGDKNFWGKGYGTEAICLILDFGFRRLNLHSVFLHVYSFNPRAVKCYQKAGFKMAGCLRQAVCRGGKYYDRYLMDILADEFYEQNPDFDRNKL